MENLAAWLKPQAIDPATLLLPYPSGQVAAWPVSRQAIDARLAGPKLAARSA